MKKLWLVLIGLALVGVLIIPSFVQHPSKNQAQAISPPSVSETNTAVPASKSGVPLESLSKLKTRWGNFSDAEKSEFISNFATRYQPALEKWSEAFSNRVPFSPGSITANNFLERIGTRPTYREYIFMVDGITLGIQDSKGVARVDYLNNPQQTGKMTVLPHDGNAPISTTPLSKDDVVKMLAAEGGTQYRPNDIRLVPSGYSGSLNGGAIVNVGGDPENAASWKYDMVFGADGKLAFYLKGNPN